MTRRCLHPFQRRHRRCHPRCLRLHRDFVDHLLGFLPQPFRQGLHLRQRPWCKFHHLHVRRVQWKRHPYQILLRSQCDSTHQFPTNKLRERYLRGPILQRIAPSQHHRCKIPLMRLVDHLTSQPWRFGHLRLLQHACPKIQQGRLQQLQQGRRPGCKYHHCPSIVDLQPLRQILPKCDTLQKGRPLRHLGFLE